MVRELEMKMTNNDMEKKVSDVYIQELWQAFEKTGSISAYILYNIARKQDVKKDRKSKEKKEKALE